MDVNSPKMEYDERRETEYMNHSDGHNSSTPVHSRASITNELNDYYSPLFSQCTQEESETIDVMWDWNSPQSKPRIRKHKRINLQQSPKLPIKRHPSNNQIAIFDKLKEDLETLRDQIVTKHVEAENEHLTPAPCKESNLAALEDAFDDSMDEQLIRCSQEVEHTVTKIETASKRHEFLEDGIKSIYNTEVIKNNNYVQHQAHSNLDHSINKNQTDISFLPKHLDTNETRIADDSFDCLLATLREEDLRLNRDAPNKTTAEPSCSNIPIKKDFQLHKQVPVKATAPLCSTTLIKKEVVDETVKSVKTETNFSATCSNVKTKVNPAKRTAEEIEQKRKEALAKLETKKKQTSCDDESPIKCSPEEIEKKRLQALAKLQAKKKQDIIEQKRQEALRRLEMSKKRRALQAQPTSPVKIYNCK